MFHTPLGLTSPATGKVFLTVCFTDGLAYNENDPTTDADDELWFSDDINRNVGLFRPDGTFVNGYDGMAVHITLQDGSGLAIGGTMLYMSNDGWGDVFRADSTTDPLTLIDMFHSGDVREEDMECDSITFAPTEVIWVRTTPQGVPANDVITAYEIEPASCGVGGTLNEACCYPDGTCADVPPQHLRRRRRCPPRPRLVLHRP